ncbi:CGNR zinc finger domain-containing protein [Roseisolibacter sp. H3M3-2]|uniref:CGNR zinc finger domain-containing protein n=1 Tax=Roseisolibacter sp. H3M3-2 TaxID=3031323 RepID=UPI0023DBC27A|nr:CGNR zinc finger domain-containing protein [Roseisolibacter sp. H3M3-2]MDF1503572.1 CGNR zinc finger domain-containing protein [Roseisolibacter sp. H3M3-2]
MTSAPILLSSAPRRDGAMPAAEGRAHEPAWLAFVNTDDGRRDELRRADGRRADVLTDFDAFVDWLQENDVVDAERAAGIRRRAYQQPAGAAASLVDARRVRAALRALDERGQASERARVDALAEINRVLGRSAGTRRVEPRADGGYARTFVTVGDAFAALMVPIVDSAADSLIGGELARVRRCADPRCARVFLDTTKNGRRRWCDMATCGNRAKAARHRARHHPPAARP